MGLWNEQQQEGNIPNKVYAPADLSNRAQVSPGAAPSNMWGGSMSEQFMQEDPTQPCISNVPIVQPDLCVKECPIKLDFTCVFYHYNRPTDPDLLGCLSPGTKQPFSLEVIIDKTALLITENICNPPVLPCFREVDPALPATPKIADIVLSLQAAVCDLKQHQAIPGWDTVLGAGNITSGKDFIMKNSSGITIMESSMNAFQGLIVRDPTGNRYAFFNGGSLTFINSIGQYAYFAPPVTNIEQPQVIYWPNLEGGLRTMPISVNGSFADDNGNINLSLTGAQNLDQVLAVGNTATGKEIFMKNVSGRTILETSINYASSLWIHSPVPDDQAYAQLSNAGLSFFNSSLFGSAFFSTSLTPITNTQGIYLPNLSGQYKTLPMSVNGVFADNFGNIVVATAPSGPAGGDLSGTYPNPTVNWINGYNTYDSRYRMITVPDAATMLATSHAVADHVIMYKTNDLNEAINGLYTWNNTAGEYTATGGGFWKKHLPGFLHHSNGDYFMQRKTHFYNTVNNSYSTSKPPIYIFLRNDTGEGVDSEWGGMICGSAYGGAINFQNNFSGHDNYRALRLGLIDNNFQFYPLLDMRYSGVLGNRVVAFVPIVPSAHNTQSIGVSDVRFNYGWFDKVMVNTATDLGWKLEVVGDSNTGPAHFTGFLNNTYPHIVRAEAGNNGVSSGAISSTYYGYMHIANGQNAPSTDFCTYYATSNSYDRGVPSHLKKLVGFKAEMSFMQGNIAVENIISEGMFGFEARVKTDYVNTAEGQITDIPRGYNFHGLPIFVNRTLTRGKFTELGHILLERIDPLDGLSTGPTPVPFAIKQVGADNYNYFEGVVTLGTITPSPSVRLHINGAMRLVGGFYDGNNLIGTNGQTLTSDGAKTIWKDSTLLIKRVTSLASSAAIIPNPTTTDVLIITALAVTTTFSAPSPAGTSAQELVIRIKDNGTAQTISWNAAYRQCADLLLPLATTAGKEMYVKFYYNAEASTWDLMGVLNGF